MQVERDRGYRGPGRDRRTLLRAGRFGRAARRYDGGGRVHARREAQAARPISELGVRRRGRDPQRHERRRGHVPRVPLGLHGPRELRRVREDREVPGRHRPDQRTQQRRRKESAQRQWLLPGQVHGLGGHDQGLKALQGRARQLGLLQLRPQVSAQGGGVKELCRRVQPVPSGQRSEGRLGLQPVLPRLACSGPAFEVSSAWRVGVGPIPRTRPHPPPRGDDTMNPKVLRWLAPGCLAATALIAATIALGSSGRDDPPARAAGNFSPYVTKDGGISRPTDYRDTFEYLGSYAVATKPDKPVDEMHVVYARPEDVRAYRRDGKFPDGATLVKEVTQVGSERLTTGQSHWATDIKLWFVMIKDAKGRFPGNDLWGDGWGWALFLAKEPARNVATDYSTDCRTCHIPARKDDWVYVRGYPVLAKAAPAK